jgi:hypothetical protein
MKLTREQAAIIGAYTGYTCGPFEDIHRKIEEVLGRPVWTHEMASDKLCDEVREKLKPQFLALCVERDAPPPTQENAG